MGTNRSTPFSGLSLSLPRTSAISLTRTSGLTYSSGIMARERPSSQSTSNTVIISSSARISGAGAARIRRLRLESTRTMVPLKARGLRISAISAAETNLSGTMRTANPARKPGPSPAMVVGAPWLGALDLGTMRKMPADGTMAVPATSRAFSSTPSTAARGIGRLVCSVMNPLTAESTTKLRLRMPPRTARTTSVISAFTKLRVMPPPFPSNARARRGALFRNLPLPRTTWRGARDLASSGFGVFAAASLMASPPAASRVPPSPRAAGASGPMRWARSNSAQAGNEEMAAMAQKRMMNFAVFPMPERFPQMRRRPPQPGLRPSLPSVWQILLKFCLIRA